MTSIIKIQESDLTKYDLSPVQIETVKSAFTPSIESIQTHDEEFVATLEQEQSPERSKRAWELRKKLVKERTSITPIHKEQKAFYLNGGRFVDGFKNSIVSCIEKAEKELEDIEEYYANIEKARIEWVHNARMESLKLFEYIDSGLRFGNMSEDDWNAYYTGVKTVFEKKKADDLAEKERLANLEKENAELRRQNEEKEKEIEAQKVIVQDISNVAELRKEQIISNNSTVKKAEEIVKSIPELISSIEAYNFTCVAGKLQSCIHWQKLKSLIS